MVLAATVMNCTLRIYSHLKTMLTGTRTRMQRVASAQRLQVPSAPAAGWGMGGSFTKHRMFSHGHRLLISSWLCLILHLGK